MSTDDTPDPSTDPAASTDRTTDGSAASADPPADGAAAPADSASATADGGGGGSTEAPTNGSTGSTTDTPADQPGSPATADSASSEATDTSGDCAEIPCAAHAVLTAAIKLAVRVPYSTDEATQLPHKLTLSNDDGSYTKTLRLASDSQPGGVDGTSMVTFEDMTEQHTYTLQCDNGDTTYMLFKDITYEQVLKFVAQDDGGSSETAAPANSPASPPAADTAGAS